MAAGLFDAARYTTFRSRFARAAVMCGVAGGQRAAPLYFARARINYQAVAADASALERVTSTRVSRSFWPGCRIAGAG